MHLTATGIVLCRTLDGIEVEAMVLQESSVLARHHRHWHMGRNLIERNPVMMQGNALAISHLLEATDKHEWRKVYRYEPICHYSKNGGTEKQHHHPSDNILDFFQNHITFSFPIKGVA